MNFRYMPELETPWGYPAVMTVCILIGLTMILYFKRRGWF
jgi:magnesium transporter